MFKTGTGNHSVYATVWLERKPTTDATLNLEQAETPHHDPDVKETVFVSLWQRVNEAGLVYL